MRQLQLDELNRATPDAYRRQQKHPIVVVLDGVRSALNVGSVFRSCDAFAVRKLYLCGITATPPHREILKTAIGADATVEWEHTKTTATALTRLKAEGYHIIAVEQTDQSVPLYELTWPSSHPLALVLGNEVMGVSPEALALCDGAVEVPQYGTKHSLNVAVCAGVVLWEVLKSHIALNQ